MGDKGIVLYTSNGGFLWQQQLRPISCRTFAVEGCFSESNHGITWNDVVVSLVFWYSVAVQLVLRRGHRVPIGLLDV